MWKQIQGAFAAWDTVQYRFLTLCLCHICPESTALVITKVMSHVSVWANPPVCTSSLIKMIFLMLEHNYCFIFIDNYSYSFAILNRKMNFSVWMFSLINSRLLIMFPLKPCSVHVAEHIQAGEWAMLSELIYTKWQSSVRSVQSHYIYVTQFTTDLKVLHTARKRLRDNCVWRCFSYKLLTWRKEHLLLPERAFILVAKALHCYSILWISSIFAHIYIYIKVFLVKPYNISCFCLKEDSLTEQQQRGSVTSPPRRLHVLTTDLQI